MSPGHTRPPDSGWTRPLDDATPSSGLDHWREDMLLTMLGVALPLGSFLVMLGIAVALYKNDLVMVVTDVVAWGLLLALHHYRHLSHQVRASGVVLLVAGVGVSFMVSRIGAYGLLWLSAVPVMAALFLGRWMALRLVALIGLGVFGWAWWADIPLEAEPLVDEPALKWGLLAFNFITINTLIAVSAAVLLRRLDAALGEARAAQEAHRRLAESDNLTGLPNRRMLHDQLRHTLLRSRQVGEASAVLFIDVDNFKDVNDTYGHLEGDQVLIQVAQRLTGEVSAPSLVARSGGDEFVVLFRPPQDPGQDIRTQVLQLTQRLRQCLEQPMNLAGGIHYHVNTSIGVSLLNRPHMTVDDVMREADTAMYRAKALGRNQVAFFEPAMREALVDRMQLEHDLGQAIQTGGLHIAVQSQVDAQHQVVGAEVLVRWTHPTRGPLSPARFIPLAEHSGLVLPLGDWVLEQACKLAQELQQRGVTCPLAINISAKQFHQPGFDQHLLSALKRHGVPPSSLMLEVTESLLVTDQTDTIAAMNRLADQGIRFSIDDFGTGYSSLSYLKKLPLHELKIDRSFVDDLPHDANDVAIVDTILSMARVLGLEVVAEGVETQDQADFLLAHGCHGLQGFLFSRPQPPEDWLASLPTTPPT
ncbi:MAG TPA: bifunctional diguanylate cyclase/phosphodiesterase, partial [Burkholderiaceae bacterium]|nr:bifunctional diguanylate cyclase/phosphodiesterase [Burkholderiaceae bacterium]